MSSPEPEPTAEQIVFDAIASTERGMGVERIIAALRQAQMLNDGPWQQIMTTSPLDTEVHNWETEVLHSDNAPPRIIAYFQTDSYGKVVSYMNPEDWEHYMVANGHATLSYRRPVIVKED